MNRTEPSVGKIESIDSLDAVDSSYYSSPKANIRNENSGTPISNWWPLIFLLFLYLAVGPTLSDGAKHIVSRNVGSLLQAGFMILTWVGMKRRSRES